MKTPARSFLILIASLLVASCQNRLRRAPDIAATDQRPPALVADDRLFSFAGGYAGRGYYYGPSGLKWYPRAPGISFYRTWKEVRESPVSRYHSISDAIDVQRALRKQGLYNGSVDGENRLSYRKALATFERYHGLIPTGRASELVLKLLQIR